MPKRNGNIDTIKTDIDKLKAVTKAISSVREKLIQKIDSLKDEFAEIKGEINDEQLDADSYVLDQKKLAANNEKAVKLKESLKSKDKLCFTIKKNLMVETNCYVKNYTEYESATREINKQQRSAFSIYSFKRDKIEFKEKLMTYFKGTDCPDVKYKAL